MIRIAHIITGLRTGGAETMLFKLLSRTSPDRFRPSVWCLTDDGPVADRIRELNIPVTCLGMRRGLPDMAGVLRLSAQLRAFRPEIVQTWLYHADVAGGIAARMAGCRTVVWNIRNSSFDPSRAKRATVLLARVGARLSRSIPDAILCCSEVAKREHIALGYASERFVLLPNGFDIRQLKPDPDARVAVRSELKFPAETPLVGMVARFDPQKDHDNFLRAAARIAAVRPDVGFVCCGDGVDPDQPALRSRAASGGIGERVRFLGRRSDIPRLNAAFDVAVSSSRYGEGFPNVIGEAMACGVPCVVTESGDGPFLVGDTGKVVPTGNDAALADALLELLSLPPERRAERGQAARQRVIDHFEIGAVAERYAEFYVSLLSRRSGVPA
ncbi:MAG: glycosyltransferase [Capsulimonadales bacterium]|nr:glycosyltransferase [Capsulimonadales bacterium]